MVMSLRPSRAVFAAMMLGLGIITLIYGSHAVIWQPIPAELPGRLIVICLCAAITLGTGIGLLLPRFVRIACRVLLPFLLLWLILLKLPTLLLAPQVMVNWEAFGEMAAISAGAWCLFAVFAGEWERRLLPFAVSERGVRVARLLFIAALPMFGLSHFAYHDLTASLVPKWMHVPLAWTYLTGAASLAAAAGMLFGFYPRLAANLESAMLWIITVFVWIPLLATAPRDQGNWSEFLISSAIATSAWLVAETYRNVPWLASGKAGRNP